MPIAAIGVVLKVTPGDDIQIVRGEGDYELVDDRSPFSLKVSELLYEGGILIGVAGPVVDGHPRYRGLVATLMTRIDGSHWETDMHSAAGFKVGSSVARRVTEFSHFHPEGVAIDGYPVIIRYGSVDAEA